MRAKRLIPFLLAAACSDSGTEPPPRDLTLIGGQVVPIVANGPVGSIELTVRVGGEAFRARTDGQGAYQMQVPLPTNPADSVDMTVDSPNGSLRFYRPISMRVPAAKAQLLTRPLLVVRSAPIVSTTFGTNTVPVSLVSAFARPCTDVTNGNCESFLPQYWLIAGALWPESAFPIPVAFNREASSSTISVADSIAFWNVVSKMSTDMGRQLFKPVSFAALPTPSGSGVSLGAVLVSIDNTLAAGAGFTNWYYDRNGDLYGAKMRVGSPAGLASGRLVPHELMHALGFGHTCAWATIMGGYGCATNLGLTVNDVAVFSLAVAIRKTIVARNPTTTLADARAGELRFEAGPLATVSPANVAVPFSPIDRQSTVVSGRLLTSVGLP